MPTGWPAAGGAPWAAVARGHAATSAQHNVTTAAAIHRPVMSVVSTRDVLASECIAPRSNAIESDRG
jgi:hypothetical protein